MLERHTPAQQLIARLQDAADAAARLLLADLEAALVERAQERRLVDGAVAETVLRIARRVLGAGRRWRESKRAACSRSLSSLTAPRAEAGKRLYAALPRRCTNVPG